MITLDLSLWIQVISILVLIAILNSIMFKPIRRMLQEREAKMSGIQEDAEKYERNAEQLLENYNVKLADARKRGQAEREKLKEEARSEEHAILEESSKEAAARKEELLAQLGSQIEAARGELKAQSESFAAQIAEKLLGRAVS